MSSGKNIENIPSEGKIISDGLEIAYLDWQATGEVYDNLLVLHPNGFCAGMFDPIASLLSENYRVVGVDLRGHGASEESEVRPRQREDEEDEVDGHDHGGGDVSRIL